MTRNLDTLERLARLSGAPSRGLDDLLRLRAKRDRARKTGTIAVVAVLIVALVGIGLEEVGDRSTPAHPPNRSAHPFEGMVIGLTGDAYEGGHLIAQDPATGKVRTVLDPQFGDPLYSMHPPYSEGPIYDAAISADGRWVAFDIHRECGDRGPELWVTNGVDEPRRLTKACPQSAEFDAVALWQWSPSTAQLLVVLGSPDAQALILIDPATGDRTDLGQASGEVTSLAWSPDGTEIAYATVPSGSPDGNSPNGSVYTISVDSGEHAVVAEALGRVPGGEEGAGLQWSPDSARIAVLADGTLYVMNADGSKRQSLAKNVLIEHILGSPNIAWSPDGTKIAYASASDDRDQFRIWSVAHNGSAQMLIFEGSGRSDGLTGGPVWSPDGTRIAFRYDTTMDDKTWLIANADGSGDVHEIDDLQPLSWRGGWFFCECYG